MELFLDKSNSKKSSTKQKTLTVQLEGSKRLLPLENINNTVDELEVYNNERKACTNIRLICNVNTICSNVLFNNLTEIVKNEGSNDVIFYNVDGVSFGDRESILANKYKVFRKNTSANELPFESKKHTLRLLAIRDTQLSSENIGYDYHCGLDIFNNHTLRSKTFKSICPFYDTRTVNSNFNTISDLARNYDGSQIMIYYDKEGRTSESPNVKAHVYLDDEIMSFKKTIDEKLIEKDGWFGFLNVKKFPMHDGKTPFDFSKTINNRRACDFIDMYPERDLFSFVPKFNPHRRRIEKNWNYCLTYPSSSTTNVSFIREKTNSLKIANFDELENGSNGINAIKFWSVSKHGLKKGYYVNIYNGNQLIIGPVAVMDVYDDFTFLINGGSHKLANEWMALKNNEELVEGLGTVGNTYSFADRSRKVVTDSGGNQYLTIDGSRFAVSETSFDLSFKRVVNGSECDYYVRIFSRIPNWRFSDSTHTEYDLYNGKSNLISTHQTNENDFENHISKLSFAKNIYNDNIAEIIYTDSIDISGLRDNLGRPLTDIYFTAVKNNAGYREWYGKNNMEIKPQSENVEYSHCFGKVSCAFRLSDESIPLKYIDADGNTYPLHPNIKTINNQSTETYWESGLTITNLINYRSDYLLNLNNANASLNSINKANLKFIEDDEIEFNEIYDLKDGSNKKIYDGDVNFYGDLCCYSKTICMEESIQQVEFRFNTAQRELNTEDTSYEYFNKMFWDEIKFDDYDNVNDGNQNFRLEEKDESSNEGVSFDVCNRKEGYCYEPHTKISVRSFSTDLTSTYPLFYKVIKIENVGNSNYVITFLNKHGLCLSNTFELFDKVRGLRYNGEIVGIVDAHTILANITLNELDLPSSVLEKDAYINLMSDNNGYIDKNEYTFFIRPENVPTYAEFIKDGSCRFYWRELLSNGYNQDVDDEEYPFTNNSFYINKNINIYLKRQNPEDVGDLWSDSFPFDATSKKQISDSPKDDLISEDIEC